MKKHILKQVACLALGLCLFVSFAFLLADGASATTGVGATDARNSVFKLSIHDGERVFYGSGFCVALDGQGGQYILTNYHVVNPSEGTAPFEIGVIWNDELVTCSLVAYDESRDLAIIRPNTSLGDITPLPLGRDSLVSVTDTVYALGFPMAALSGNSAWRPEEVTINSGNISLMPIYQNVAYYQFNAAISGGNSGGPLLHADGFVIGVCTMKMDNVEGIYGAVRIDEALALMDDNSIAYVLLNASPVNTQGGQNTDGPDLPQTPATVVPSPSDLPAVATPQKNTIGIWIGIFITSLVLLIGLLVYLRWQKKSGKKGLGFMLPKKKTFGQVVGISGPYRGSVIALSADTLFFGRDPMKCQLVFSQEEIQISRVHCSLRYDEVQGVYVLENYSRNGTFLYDGRPIEGGQPAILNEGDRFYLADERNTFELGNAAQRPQ